MKPEYQLISFHIIEKFNNNKLITWSYPSISVKSKEVLLGRTFEQKDALKYAFYRTAENEWLYIWERCIEHKTYALGLVTKHFSPNKYQKFGKVLCGRYEKSFNPVELVKMYLGVYTTGFYTAQENGTHIKVDCAGSEAQGNVKDLISLFGVEIVLIYNALLLKKRVVVYHPDMQNLQMNLLAITSLIEDKCRDPDEYLFPLVRNINAELKGKSFFMAGIRDKNMAVRGDSYDIFVNLQTGVIKISANSKEIFSVTKVHKEIAMNLVQMAGSEECANAKLSAWIHEKTAEIILNLKGLAEVQTDGERPMITLEALRSRNISGAMENFLFNLAVAENIMML